jgi:hypothetical protein
MKLLAQAAALLLAAKIAVAATEPGIPAFPIPETDLTLRAEATSRRFIAAHGQRGMIVGYAAEGLEGWIYPFRIFHDFRIGIRTEGSSHAIPGSALVRDIVVRPESVTRTYSGQNFTVRETIFVPLEVPGFAILYEVDTRFPLHIVASFRPDLDLMWPGGIGGQSFSWDAGLRAFILQESSQKYSALVGSPVAGLHSPPASYAEPWDADRRLSFELDIPASGAEPHYFPILVSLTLPGHCDAARTYDQLLRDTPRLYAQAAEHYRTLVASNLQIETPSREVNLAYAWARITLEQAYVCNPFLGCGLVAGYGPSRDTRRPQYAWFFGGDAMINTWALEAAGDRERARHAFRFIQKYQEKNTGEIFHELSQSAGLIDWFENYPYGYRHTDASAMYLVTMGNLYRSSGDLEFIRSSWDSLRAAYRYLLSRLDPEDGFVTVPPGGWGGDETIGEQVLKDIYLESLWVAGAEALAELAEAVGETRLAEEARQHGTKARDSIASRLWYPQRNFFFYGFNADGNLLIQELSQPSWGIWLGAFDAEKAELALDRMARAEWVADWGVRSIPTGDALYIGDSYGHGSVWPLGTGIQALAGYRFHRPLQAFPLWNALVEQTWLNSLGHVTEVLSGDFYRELDVSVPEQIWSSGMVITGLLRGLLGLRPDAPNSRLEFGPHLPPDWRGINLRNLQVGATALALEMEQSSSQVRLRIESSGPPLDVTFAPEIPLGAVNLRATVNGKRASLAPGVHGHDAHAEIRFRAEGKTEVVLTFEPGLRAWVPPRLLRIGDVSRGLRVLSSRLAGSSYIAEVEGRPGACSALVLHTPWQVKAVTGGKLVSAIPGRAEFIASPAPDSCGAETEYETWTFQVEFTSPRSP